ncbi:MAG: rRNA maturation RNase YbeY [Pseudomonadota bacterium]
MTRPEARVEIALQDPRWTALKLDKLAVEAITATLSKLGMSPDAFEVSLLGCDDARIAALNAEFRGKPAPTNVLSWPSADRAPKTPGALPRLPDPDTQMETELGDLAIAYETCMAEAQTAKISATAHVTHLIVHGTLHLLGFDHISDADAERMETLEVAILATLGIADPYDISVLD